MSVYRGILTLGFLFPLISLPSPTGDLSTASCLAGSAMDFGFGGERRRHATVQERGRGRQELLYRLTVDLPGRSAGSHLRGEYMVRSGEHVFAEGRIDLSDLSTPEGRSFDAEIDLQGLDLTGQEILWRFRGEIYDATLAKTIEPQMLRSTRWTQSLRAVGYRITITPSGDLRPVELVERDEAGPAPGNPAGEAVFPPEPGGQFPVGVRSYFWIDEDRGEAFTADPTDKRHLLVQVWYPAGRTEGARRASYLQDPEAFGPAGPGSVTARQWTHSFVDVPVSGERPEYPVLIFNHGMNATRFSSTFLMEHFASHGYVVFSIGHTFFNGVEVFPDGYRAVQDVFPEPEPASSQEESYRRFSEFMYHHRVVPMSEDTRFVLDQVETLDRDGDSPFHGRLNLDQVGALGWSIGGVSAAHTLSSDSRVRVGANLDGTFDGVVAGEGVDRPFMYLKGERAVAGEDTEEFRRMVLEIQGNEDEFVKNSEEVFVMAVAGASHMDFSDLPLIDAPPGEGTGTRRRHEIIRALTLAFFDQYLVGRETVDLMELAKSYSDVVIIQPPGLDPVIR